MRTRTLIKKPTQKFYDDFVYTIEWRQPDDTPTKKHSTQVYPSYDSALGMAIVEVAGLIFGITTDEKVGAVHLSRDEFQQMYNARRQEFDIRCSEMNMNVKIFGIRYNKFDFDMRDLFV
jgi:hypothetical protein